MNILERAFKVKDTHERSVSSFRKSYQTQIEQIKQTHDQRSVYEYKALIRVRFTANSADYGLALQNAKMQMQDYVYSEVLLGLREIESCVYDGDAMAAMERIGALRSLIRDID
jgi:hypothetical protein